MALPPTRTILACVDFSACSRSALLQAQRLSAAQGAALHVLHVVERHVVDDLAEALRRDPGALLADVLEDARRRLAQFWTDLRRPGEPVLDVAAGVLVDQVMEKVESAHVDLLVLGVRGEAGAQGAGSLATACVRRSPVPVLVVREGQEGPWASIAVGIDFSPNACHATVHAARLARLDGAPLALVHAFFPPWNRLHYGAPTPEAEPHFRRQYGSILEGRLRGFGGSCGADLAGLGLRHVLEESTSHGAGLLAGARRVGADLVVVGTEGRGRLRKRLLGSTAERVLREAEASVLAVRPAREP